LRISSQRVRDGEAQKETTVFTALSHQCGVNMLRDVVNTRFLSVDLGPDAKPRLVLQLLLRLMLHYRLQILARLVQCKRMRNRGSLGAELPRLLATFGD
jgi:hypothetical protein